jgi:V/A-type H+-transporting ATPase subunit D
MAATTVNPTRMELTRLKKKLVTARRGYKLLKDKRDELMRQFLDLVRENKELREKVESGISGSQPQFCAGAVPACPMRPCAWRSCLRSRKVSLNVHTRNIMSVDVPVYELRDPDAGQQ